jgi:tetrahydromethanopterin S-methyltransferase subunit G
MTTPSLTFDRLAYIDRLKEAGVDDKQARAHAEALDTALRDRVATTADLREVTLELREVKLELEAKIEFVKSDILKWMFGTIGFQTIIILGAVIALARMVHP